MSAQRVDPMAKYAIYGAMRSARRRMTAARAFVQADDLIAAREQVESAQRGLALVRARIIARIEGQS